MDRVVKIGMIERSLTLQLSGQVMAMARQPISKSYLQDKEAFRNVQGSLGVLCCGEKDAQILFGLSVLKYPRRGHGLQVWRLQFSSCRSSSRSSWSEGISLRRAKLKGFAFCSVLNEEVDQNSSQAPLGPASPDGLKDQLEALQEEASQVHNRYNSARARYVRMTEVAQELSRRAAIDLKLGNEDGARKALIEKKKVIQAAELSKRRAQLLDELSTKLGEAISAKETQYIVALSAPPREEHTVRVVSPKGESSSESFDQDLDDERSPSFLGTSEISQILEATDAFDLAAATEDMNGGTRQVLPESGDVLSLDTKLGYSADSLITRNDEDVEATLPVHDSNNMKVPLERDEIADDRDINVKSGGSLIGPSEPTMKSNPEYVHAGDGSGKVGTLGHEGVGQAQRIEAIGSASFNDGRRLLVEQLILDVDYQATTIESRLKTEVSRNNGLNDTELEMVADLLEQVQGLRKRISEVVVLLSQKEMS